LLGSGLAFPLGAFDVEIDPRRPPAVLRRRDVGGATPCAMAEVAVDRGYAAVVAVPGERITVFPHAFGGREGQDAGRPDSPQ